MRIWMLLTCLLTALAPLRASDMLCSVSPLSSTYTMADPVAVAVIWKNTGTLPVHFERYFPAEPHLCFTCRDDDAVPRYSEGLRWELAPVSVAPNGEARMVAALARWFRFKKAKPYSIEYRHPHTGGDEPALGSFTVRLEPGAISPSRLAAIRQGLTHRDEARRLEAVELLCWVDDDSVIDGLVQAARAAPICGYHIVHALGKLSALDRGRTAIFEVASLSHYSALDALFPVCAEANVTIPTSFYRQTLLSGVRGKQLIVLEQLASVGTTVHLPYMEPLASHRDADVAEAARKAVRSIRNRSDSGERPPAGTPGDASVHRDGDGQHVLSALHIVAIAVLLAIGILVWLASARLRLRRRKGQGPS